MLEANGVGFFEEPCPWEEYEETKRVTDALDMTVAGGEQDSSLPRFAWMIQNGVVDLVQPDLAYNGGFTRCLRVAKMAQTGGLQITPHCPKADPNTAYMLHFAAVVPNLGPHQEYRGMRREGGEAWWRSPSFDVREGTVPVPDGPGLGVEYDPAIWREAEQV
jgi:L-alanine-DL-glutamate epimerase-like enolase superfamily enzyme